MSGKKNKMASTSGQLPALRIGSRVRCRCNDECQAPSM
jgi:hypothetical protein